MINQFGQFQTPVCKAPNSSLDKENSLIYYFVVAPKKMHYKVPLQVGLPLSNCVLVNIAIAKG